MKKTLGDFLFVSVPKILGGAGTLVLNLLLMRYLPPSEFGVYSLCVAMILLSDAILGSAFDFGVVRLASVAGPESLSRSLAVQRAALLIKFAGAIVLSVCVVIAARPLSMVLFHRAGQEQFLYMTCAAVLALLLLRSAQLNMQVAGRFRMYASLDVLHLALRLGGVFLLIPLGWISVRLTLLTYILAPTLAFLGWAAGFGRHLLRHLFPDPGITRDLVRFVKWFLLTFALANLLVRIDVFLLSRWTTLDQVGIYAGGQVIALIPQLLGTYLAVVMSPKIMPYWETGRLEHFFRQYHVLALLACIVIYILGRALLQMFAPLLLPHLFSRSLQVILILLPGAIAGFLIFPVAIPFLMFVRPRFLFVMDVIALPLLLLAYWVAIPSRGIIGAAWITSGYACVKATMALALAWRWSRHREPFRSPFAGNVLPPIGAFEGGSVE